MADPVTTPSSAPQSDFQYIKLPDGSYGKFAGNADDATIQSAIQKDFPDAFGQKSTDPSGRTPTGEPAEGDKRFPIQRAMDNLTTPDPRREEWQSPVRTGMDRFAQGVASNVLPILAHPLKSAGGIVHSLGNAIAESGGDPQGMARNLVTPMVESAINDYQENGPAKAIPHMLGQGTGLWATGELTAPAVRAAGDVADLIPRRARAVENFKDVMQHAGNQPVQLNQSSEPLMRAFDLSQRGAQLPKVVRQLVQRTTTPEAAPLTYAEARDFASNLSRMSSKDVQSLTPAMRSQVGATSKAFNADVGEAANAAGKGPEYESAMKEYAQNARMRDVLKRAGQVGAGALGAATAYKIAHEFLPR